MNAIPAARHDRCSDERMRERSRAPRSCLHESKVAALRLVVVAACSCGPALPVAQAVDTDIQISATALDFGAVAVGSTVTLSVTLTNGGGDPFGPINMFGGAPPTAEFNASQNCQAKTLPAGGSCTVNYSFTPSAQGTFNDSSNFTVSETPSQSDGEDFSVKLTGIGTTVAPPPPPKQVPTTTTLGCAPDPSALFQPVTCTARVTAPSGTPTGSVAFTVDGNSVAMDQVDGTGRARFTTPLLALGTHSIVARYTPNVTMFVASTSAPYLQAVVTPIETLTAVEYFHSGFGHYFVTSFAAEISALDGGAFAGAWQRTGRTFPVYENPDPGTSPVCRFFSASFAPKSSHFYTPFATECDDVKANPDWQFEAIAFYLKTPSDAGSCPLGSAPLYRLYNNGMSGAPNHRYTTRNDIVMQMQALGWVAEGFGGPVVFACIPSP